MSKEIGYHVVENEACNCAFHGFKPKTSEIMMQCSSYVLKGVDLSYLKPSQLSSSNQLFRFTFTFICSLFTALWLVAFTVISMLINQVYAVKKPNLTRSWYWFTYRFWYLFFNILGADKLELWSQKCSLSYGDYTFSDVCSRKKEDCRQSEN